MERPVKLELTLDEAFSLRCAINHYLDRIRVTVDNAGIKNELREVNGRLVDAEAVGRGFGCAVVKAGAA